MSPISCFKYQRLTFGHAKSRILMWHICIGEVAYEFRGFKLLGIVGYRAILPWPFSVLLFGSISWHFTCCVFLSRLHLHPCTKYSNNSGPSLILLYSIYLSKLLLLVEVQTITRTYSNTKSVAMLNVISLKWIFYSIVEKKSIHWHKLSNITTTTTNDLRLITNMKNHSLLVF